MSTTPASTRPLTTVPEDHDVHSEHSSLESAFARQDGREARLDVLRHYASLQEYADAVRNAHSAPDGDRMSPQPAKRREGFTWEADTKAQPVRTPFPQSLSIPKTPPPLEDMIDRTAMQDLIGPSASSVDDAEGILEVAASEAADNATTFSKSISRSDTSRSSIGHLAKGVLRRVPDVRMLALMEPVLSSSSNNTVQTSRKHVVAEEGPPSLVPAQTSRAQPAEHTKMRQSAGRDIVNTVPSTKGSLLDRRKPARGAEMRLVLPQQMPALPARSRPPIVSDLSSLRSARSRSPKTPKIFDNASSWYTAGQASAPATIFEDEHAASAGRPEAASHDQVPTPLSDGDAYRVHSRVSLRKHGLRSTRSDRTSSSQSETETPKTGISLGRVVEAVETHQRQTDQSHDHRELQALGKNSHFKTRRWPWAGRSGSDKLVNSPPPNQHPPFARVNFSQSDQSNQHTNVAPDTFANRGLSFWRRLKLNCAKTDTGVNAMAKMAVPPVFDPPGLHRIPTPPVLDANGDVKDKLADFFFEVQGVRTRKVASSPGGIWDSDLLLMSQEKDYSPPMNHEEVEESPQGSPTMTPLFQEDINIITNSLTVKSHFSLPGTPLRPPTTLHEGRDPALSRLRNDSEGFVVRTAEEVAKLEWLIPEHLANSPLCPLHVKYKGPSRDVCVYHGARRASLIKHESSSRRGGNSSLGSRGVWKRRGSNMVTDGSLDEAEGLGWRRGWRWPS